MEDFDSWKPFFICNTESTQTGDLRIVRIDKHASYCTGDEEVFILVEKVDKRKRVLRSYYITLCVYVCGAAKLIIPHTLGMQTRLMQQILPYEMTGTFPILIYLQCVTHKQAPILPWNRLKLASWDALF